jgi:hypothetical protein
MTIWYIFVRFWYHVPKKIWQPEKGRPDKKDLLMTGPASGVHEVACMPITPQ